MGDYNALQKQFVVISSTQPTATFEGKLWRDTSTGTLKQWDGSSWVAVQTSPDGVTLIKNQNGNLQVAPTRVVADFENDLGDWTIDIIDNTNDDADNGRSGTFSYNGSYSCCLYARKVNDFALVNIYASFDFTDYDVLKAFVYPTTQDGDAEIQIDGSQEVNINYITADAWNEIVIDISSMTGVHEIKFIGEDSDSNDNRGPSYYFDYLLLEKSPNVDGSGAGGVV